MQHIRRLCREAKQKVTVQISPNSLSVRKSVIHMRVKIQSDVNKYSQIFDAVHPRTGHEGPEGE
jgi:hypothetical protein